jgi:O-succinylbenzoate synthase
VPVASSSQSGPMTELPAVAIAAVELRRIDLPLVTPFRTSFGTQLHRDILLVHVRTTHGVDGWGECVAGTDPLYSPEYTECAHDVTRAHLLPRLRAEAGKLSADRLHILLAPVKGHAMAKAALEMAVFDAQLRTADLSMSHHVGGSRSAVPVGVSVGITESVDAIVETVAGYVDDGYGRVKLKIEPGFDIEPVTAVRAAFPKLALQVDANTAYSLADVEHLGRLDALDLLLIEQPFDEDDLLDHAELARRVATPICLDESIVSIHVAEQALAIGACSIVNIKPGRVGGYLPAKAIHDFCFDQGVPVWCGGMLETGIGRAANLALASLPGFTLPGDISASARYWRRDITPFFELGPDSSIAVPDGPGLGVDVDAAFLDTVTRQQEEITW